MYRRGGFHQLFEAFVTLGIKCSDLYSSKRKEKSWLGKIARTVC
jgi:hypothetical protein